LFNNAKEKIHRFRVKAATWEAETCTETAARKSGLSERLKALKIAVSNFFQSVSTNSPAKCQMKLFCLSSSHFKGSIMGKRDIGKGGKNQLQVINPHAAEIDVGSKFHIVAVAADLDPGYIWIRKKTFWRRPPECFWIVATTVLRWPSSPTN